MEPLSGLSTNHLGRHRLHFETLASTNDYCKDHAESLPDGAAVTAAQQTGGKGRLGRRWESPPGSGLALSVLVKGLSPEQLGFLPLLAGLAVCDGIRRVSGFRCCVKWSNDVLAHNKKLCGILCESRITGDKAFAVIGIGVNLRQNPSELERLGLVYATSLLAVTGNFYEPDALAAAILNRLEPLLDDYRSRGAEQFLPAYRELCITLGREVRVLRQGEARVGVALDIHPDGGLLCNLDGQLHKISAGEASVRGLYGYV